MIKTVKPSTRKYVTWRGFVDVIFGIILLVAIGGAYGFWWGIVAVLMMILHLMWNIETGFIKGFMRAHRIHASSRPDLEQIIGIGRWFGKVLWSDGRYT